MSYCGPVCNVPFSLGSCYGGLTSCGLPPPCGPGSIYGTGAWSGFGCLTGTSGPLPSYGLGSLSGMGGWSGYGTLSHTNVSCTDQLPGSEVVVQPPPSVVTIPGPVLSATSEPVAVAQTSFSGLGSQGLSPLYSGSALGGYRRPGLYGSGLYGSGLYCGGLYRGWRRYGQRCLPYSGWGYGACAPCEPCGPC